MQNAVAAIPAYRDALSQFDNLNNFVRDSPKHLRWFKSLQQTDAISIRLYFPTHWVLRENDLSSVIANYVELWVFMDDVSHGDKSNAEAKAAGFANQLS